MKRYYQCKKQIFFCCFNYQFSFYSKNEHLFIIDHENCICTNIYFNKKFHVDQYYHVKLSRANYTSPNKDLSLH